MSHGNDAADLTAQEMLALFRSRELSPVEAAKSCLARIRKHDEKVNAFCYLDEEATLDAARRSEERYRRGRPMGRVDGVPVAIKDMFLTRGQPNRKGSKVIDPAQAPDEDAPAVAALRRHGMVSVGRTTAPEFGWKGVTDSFLTGVTTNPWDPTKTAGGSSGGSGAAVPLGMAPLALGTDAGGSIRIPAGFCGTVGLKPTQGRCPMWPVSAFGALAHVGPMTWTVADTALLMDVLSEPDARDQTLPPLSYRFSDVLEEDVRGLRVAFSLDFGYVDVDPQVAEAVKRAARALEDLGMKVELADPGFDDPLESFGRLFYGGAANALRDIDAEKRKQMDPGLVRVAEDASRMSGLDYLQATNVKGALTEQMSRFHERYDLLVSPTLPIAAFEAGLECPKDWSHERWPTWTPFTYPFNMTGQPAISVPCGFTDRGLPIGLHIIGARHADALVMRAAHAYQCACPLTDRRPSL